MKIFLVVIFALSLSCSIALDNGLAKTPPMGWTSGVRFNCETDCKKFPKLCISETLIREIADRMAQDGYLKAGYEYVIIDDCWLANTRDAKGMLQEDPKRFPSGFQTLSDYLHLRGLKLGVQISSGKENCNKGLPGMQDNYKKDVEFFARARVDYVKIDNCHTDKVKEANIEISKHILNSKRPTVLSCTWPLYDSKVELDLVAKHCNLWRNSRNIEDSWKSVLDTINDSGNNQKKYVRHAKPGQWNDPDTLVIGNYGLSTPQAKVQMAMWSILAAPLIMSNDLRDIKPEFRDILLNKGAIAINQDKLGVQGERKYNKDDIQIWTKQIEPVIDKEYSWGIAVFSSCTVGVPFTVEVGLKDIELSDSKTYTFEEVFDAMKPFDVRPGEKLKVGVPPLSAFLFKATLKK